LLSGLTQRLLCGGSGWTDLARGDAGSAESFARRESAAQIEELQMQNWELSRTLAAKEDELAKAKQAINQQKGRAKHTEEVKKLKGLLSDAHAKLQGANVSSCVAGPRALRHSKLCASDSVVSECPDMIAMVPDDHDEDME
jgi:hypothetical protein